MIILRSRVSLLGHWKPGWLRFDIVCYNSSFCWLLLLGGDSFTVTNTQCTHTRTQTLACRNTHTHVSTVFLRAFVLLPIRHVGPFFLNGTATACVCVCECVACVLFMALATITSQNRERSFGQERARGRMCQAFKAFSRLFLSSSAS